MTMTHSDLFGKKIVIRSFFVTPLIFLFIVLVMSSNPSFGNISDIQKAVLPFIAITFALVGIISNVFARFTLEQQLKNTEQDFPILLIMMTFSEIPVILGLILTILLEEIIYFFGFFVLTYLLMLWNFGLVKNWEQKMQEDQDQTGMYA
ncbi:MAG: hypothetical protein V1672_00230 [Candidatus Diapherotrites archaeon]